jgi:flagellar motor switch protein FliN
MADENLVNQDEIERLLQQAQQGAAAPARQQAAAAKEASAAADKAKQGVAESLTAPQGASTKASPAAAPAKPASQESDDDRLLGQDDIEKLLNQAGKAPAPPPPAPVMEKEAPTASFAGEGTMASSDVDYLLSQAEQALASIGASAAGDLPQGVAAFRLPEFSGAPASSEVATLELVRDVELDLKIELGRTHMYLEDVLKLRKGSVVPLDKLAGDPVDIYVNGRLIARGEVLVLNENFCVRVAELIAGSNVFA